MTSAKAYTPGPWNVGPSGPNRCPTIGSSGLLVAMVAHGENHPTDANARLISATTDLLEAAQAAWNCIGELPPTQARVEVAQMLQAAIEKAVGERP